jgi:hypothetical protein
MTSSEVTLGGRINSIANDCRMQSRAMPLAVSLETSTGLSSTANPSYLYSSSNACLASQIASVSIDNSLSGDSDSLSAHSALNVTKSNPYNNGTIYPCTQQSAEHTPQSGLDLRLIDTISSFIRELGKFGSVPIQDELIAEVEGLVALMINIQGCSDYVSVVAAIFLYARNFFGSSVSSQIAAYAHELFDITPQSSEESASADPEWLEMMKNSRDNWALCKGNRLFDHFSKLLGLMVTLGMCKASNVTFSIKEYKVFEPDMKMIHGSAIDIADAAFGTVTFFVEGMYASFQQGNLRPFLSDRAATEIDEEYSKVILWWGLVKNGNLMRVTGISESEFDRRLETLTTKLKNLMGGTKNFEKKLISDKYSRLLGVRNDYVTLKISSGVRKAPFAIELSGESSQGKTTIGDQIADALLSSAGLPTGKEYRASYNPSDKYMSNWSTNMEVMVIDDMANEKENFVERPPTRVIIDVCNNQPYYANMADVDSKGKVFVEPSLVVVNTNIKDLDARVYSNCPYSIQRRMHVVITVKAKAEFQRIIDGKPQGIDSSKVRKKYAELGIEPTFDDIWLLSVERAIQPPTLKSSASYGVLSYRGEPLKDVPFRLVLQFLIEEFQSHIEDQVSILDRMKFRSKELDLCGHEECKQIRGYCDKHDHLERQFGDEILESINSAGKIVTNRIKKDIFGLDRCVEGVTSLVLLGSARLFASHWDWLKVFPTPWLKNPQCQKLMMFFDYNTLRKNYIKRTCIMWGFAATSVGLLAFKSKDRAVTCSLGTGIAALCITRQKSMVKIVTRQYRDKLVDRNIVAPCVQEWRDKYAGTICKAAGVVGALYALSRLYKRWVALREQGSLEPKTQSDIDERDATLSPWTGVATRDLPISTESRTSTADDLSTVVAKNLVYGTIVAGDRTLMVNGLFIRSNLIVIPSHYFETDTLDCTFRKNNPDACGGKFVVKLSRSASYRIPNTDLCLCYSSTGGSFKDLTNWFPDSNLPAHQFSMLWRSKQGEITRAQGLASPMITTNTVCDFEGGIYSNLSMNTFRGLCGAVLISHGKGTCISGFHLGGKADTKKGCYGVLTRVQIAEAISVLRSYEGVIFSGSAENFEKQVLGVNVISDKPLHPKSPMNYMPENSQVAYFGSCPGAVSSSSDAKVTLISEAVTDITGEPNIYCGPKMRPEWFGWQTCLANLAVPAHPYPHDLLSTCIKDYKLTLVPLYQSSLWKHSRPLTDHENLNGIPGKKFVDSVNLSTSIGFPLIGNKRGFVTELPPTDDKPNNRIFDAIISTEIERCHDCYRRGERAYTIAKACKKDEILTKDKCRIFYGNPIALTWLIRKYFLPILRVMQMNPLESECAVGINSHGPEWQQCHDHLHTFGADRLIGGDYGKYDQKLPSQLIFASLRIMIDFARECDYSEEDLSIMEAMTGDIVFALIAFNGDLIGLTEGTHISGNSLTVVINGICGSLNLRAYFYSQHSSAMPFRQFVKLMTYGDDNIGSVHKSITNFTIKGISEFLAGYGQVYTMPDKESELLDFLPPADLEFLKRKSTFCEEKGIHVGALAEKSIFKMLHMYLRPKSTVDSEELASAKNIDTALREWSNHGRNVYESRRNDMLAVATQSGVVHLCTQLDVDYSTVVLNWKRKYDKDYELYDELSEDPFLPQL